MRAILDNAPKAPSSLVEAIANEGVEVIRGCWQPNATLLERMDGCFVSMYDCLKQPLEVWRLKRALVRHGVPLVVWNRDAPGYMNKARWRLSLLERSGLIDIYASHSLADGRRFARTQLLLQNAARTEVYNLGGLRLEDLERAGHYQHDVGFIGSMAGERHKEYRARAEFFAALAARLDALGISHAFVDTGKMLLAPGQQRERVQRTRINLNFGSGCEFGQRIGHGLPERCFGVPACGGFLLSDRRLHAKDAFEPGTEWVDFDGLEDAIEHIRHYLVRFDEARGIARRAHARVVREHTYRHRAETVLAAIGAWRAARRRAA